MAPPLTASGSLKRERPSDNTPDSSSKSKRHDLHAYRDNASPVSDNDDVDEEDAKATEDGPYSEAQEALPKHPAFDKALRRSRKRLRR
jgi:hypothetical protein